MKLYITHHMFGKIVEQIGEDYSDFDSAMKALGDWTESADNRTKYKIETYSRIIMRENERAVDFGDYSYFGLITEDAHGSDCRLD